LLMQKMINIYRKKQYWVNYIRSTLWGKQNENVKREIILHF